MFKFDLMVAVVDVDGSEFAEDIFAEESVEVGAQNVAKAVEIHDGDAAGEPCVAIELEIDGKNDGFADETGLLASTLSEAKTVADVAVDFRADDRPRGARVEQKCDGLTVHLALHEDHRLDRAKRKIDDVGLCEVWQGYE